MSSPRILHARYVFPIVGEPIEDGFVSIEEGRIAEVGKNPPSGERIELGNVALLPGFVNAHTHLEFSGLTEPIGTPGMGFVDWIREVIAWRNGHLLEAETDLAMGICECTQQGVTTVANISQVGEFQITYKNILCDGIRFFEFIASKTDFIRAHLLLMQKGQNYPYASNYLDWKFGLSPHAPYSVDPFTLECIIDISGTEQIPLAMHLAESREEMQLLEQSCGPFRDFLQERNMFHASSFPGGIRPLNYLKMLVSASRVLVIHGNYLNDEEIDFLAEQSTKMAVVYCPRTHAFFRHDPYPLEKMLAAGVTVALGTDSRASSPDLSLLAEMRFMARHYPQIDGGRILRMGTLDAACALGRSDEIGSLEAGKFANFAALALPEKEEADPYRLLLNAEGPVVQTWFRGQIAE